MKKISDLKNDVHQFDRNIARLIDRILPQDLTLRYLIGLGVVATFSIFGQILIQTSLTDQLHMQDEIRQLDNNLPVIDDLKRATLTLQLSSRPASAQSQTASIKSFSERLKITVPASDLPQGIAVKLYSADKDLTRNTQAILGLLERHNRSARANEIGLVADHLIASIDDATRAIKSTNDYLESRHRKQVSDFQKVELLLTLLTLATLALEALYVFRPAVRKLYESLQIRSDFLSRMSHEIRNPMNSIIGMANLLHETPINDQQKRYLSILTRSSRGLLDLLNNLLDFSSAEAGKLKVENIPFELHEVLERSLDLAVLGAQAHGLELILDIQPNVPLKLLGDPSKLQQVLTNLLGNAVKFTKKGHVLLKIEADTFNEEVSLTFSVTDTGVGIDSDRLPTVFDPFVQEDSSVKRRFGGSGLGLTISKQIVDKMGGTINVTSVKGTGSTFRFSVNLAMHEPVTVKSFVEANPLSDFQVTFVKRKSIVTEMLQGFVALCGGKYDREESVEAVIEKLKASPGNHLFVLDHEFVKSKMPTLLPLLARTTFDANRLIFLIKTTATSEDLAVIGRLGVRNLLFKPIKPLPFFEAMQIGLAVRPKTAVMEPEKAKIIASQLRPLKILVVDDSHDNLTLVSLYLEGTPHRATYADSGILAIQKFKEDRFDVVLMDLQMPEVDGYTATRTIREWERSMNVPTIPIIALSAHDLTHNPEEVKSAGFTLQLVKPIDATTLLLSLQNTVAPAKAIAQDTAERIQNLEKKLAAMAPAYLEKRRIELESLYRFLEERDFKSIQMIGHRLKGNAKTYNFGKLADIGADMESAAEREDIDAVKACVNQADQFIASKYAH